MEVNLKIETGTGLQANDSSSVNESKSYTVNSGDNIWNIVKSNYNCSSNSEIGKIVKQVVQENNIENPNLIYNGQELYLPQNDKIIFGDTSASKVDKFDEWTDEETLDKYLEGEDIEDFEMFEFDASTYSSDLKNFAQEYIDKYDESGEGNLDLAEFINMATSGEGIPEEYSEEYEKLYTELFNSLNLDDKESISAAEFATMLYASDMDWENFKATGGDVASSLDGKLDWVNYQSYSSLLPSSDEKENVQYENLQYQRQMFYDNYYA